MPTSGQLQAHGMDGVSTFNYWQISSETVPVEAAAID